MEPKKKKILLVEDETVLRESVRDWLTEDGYDVECVETGRRLWRKSRRRSMALLFLT